MNINSPLVSVCHPMYVTRIKSSKNIIELFMELSDLIKNNKNVKVFAINDSAATFVWADNETHATNNTYSFSKEEMSLMDNISCKDIMDWIKNNSDKIEKIINLKVFL
jgi:hypothetical protein